MAIYTFNGEDIRVPDGESIDVARAVVEQLRSRGVECSSDGATIVIPQQRMSAAFTCSIRKVSGYHRHLARTREIQRDRRRRAVYRRLRSGDPWLADASICQMFTEYARKIRFTDMPGGGVCRCLNPDSPIVCEGC